MEVESERGIRNGWVHRLVLGHVVSERIWAIIDQKLVHYKHSIYRTQRDLAIALIDESFAADDVVCPTVLLSKHKWLGERQQERTRSS